MPALTEGYLILLTTSSFAFFALAMKMCLKSKCDKVECFCFKIHRNTDQETDVEMQTPPTPTVGFGRV